MIMVMCMTIVMMGCNGLSDGQVQVLDTMQDKTKQKLSVEAILDSALELYNYNIADGNVRVFFEMMGEYGLNLYTMTSTDRKPSKVELVYDRYHNGVNFLADGWMTPLYYKVSPDGKSLYIVSRMHANSDGWITEYQLFMIDCESLESKLLAECAALEATEKGFTIAVARLTNEDTAQFTYQKEWVMHDVKLDWDGNIVATSSQEYSMEKMHGRFAVDEDDCHLVKGFQRHILDEY